MNKIFKFYIIIAVVSIFSCENEDTKLPYLGVHSTIGKDTTYYKLPKYEFSNQDGNAFGSAQLQSKPYIAYFFFTSCPQVCPRMTQSAKRIQRALGNSNSNFNIVAFSIDPERDTYEKLREFSKKYDAELSNWHFLRGDEEKISELGMKSFYIGISKDEMEPGGFLHSEKMILVDQDGHLRGYYAGTDAEETKNLISDMKLLIGENEK